jgi:hypothetical protein
MTKRNNTRTRVQPQPDHIDSGDEARGAVNSRANQTRTQPEPDPATRAMGDDTDTLAKVAQLKPLGARKSLLASVASEGAQAAAEKLRTIGTARQQLAEAKDLFAGSETERQKARELAAKVGVSIYQARANGLVSAEETNAMLGDIFGYRGKGDDKNKALPANHPNAGKTPFGEGEAIRKRIVRLAQASEYVAGGEASTFFEDIDKDRVEAVLNGVNDGNVGFWAAYEDLAAIKREGSSGRIPPAFDPKAIAKIVNDLAGADAPSILANSVMLQRAYASLQNMLRVVDEQAAELVAEAA